MAIHFISPAPNAFMEKSGNNISVINMLCIILSVKLSVVKMPVVIPIIIM